MTPPTQQDKPIDLEALRLAAEAVEKHRRAGHLINFYNANTAYEKIAHPAAILALLALIDAQQKQIAERDTKLREAVGIVCEGWTLPDGARKTLEAALWANP